MFPVSMRALERDRFGPAALTFAFSGLVFAACLAWLVFAQLPVRIGSVTARIEADAQVQPVASRTDGRVLTLAMRLNQEVAEGDVLAELDATAERSLLEEERGKQASARLQRTALEAQIASRETSLRLARVAAEAAVKEAHANRESAEEAARLSEAEAERARRLRDAKLIPEADLQRAGALARGTRRVEEGLALQIERVASDRDAAVASAQAELSSLRQQIEKLAGDVDAATATIRRLEQALNDRTIRSPTHGRIERLAEVAVGSVVRTGDVLGTIVPSSGLRVVASFRASDSVGRLRPGQLARLTLDTFPWTEFGSLNAQVQAVAREAQQGLVRVELTLRGTNGFHGAVEHGLTGRAEVEVERLSPAALVLRTTTGRLLQAAAR